jgi:prepilin-type N-terminal cleavage/methylation domain-containing protein
MEFKPTNTKAHRRAGFTLVEMVVAMSIGCILLLFVSSYYLFSLGSFASMASYTSLNVKSRNASDLISRDLRSALSVQSLVSNQLVLNEPSGANCTYAYDASKGNLTRDDGTRTQVLLTGIVPNSFAFSFYGRPTNASPAYESFPGSVPNGAKLVSVKWLCARPGAAGAPAKSEGIQMAIINLRNQ